MTIDEILNLTVETLRANFPESLYSGFLVKENRVFDPATNSTTTSQTLQNVEMILDNLSQDEIQASGIISTDIKLYIIGDNLQEVDYYDFIQFKGLNYRVVRKIESLVGSKAALWTIICRK